MPDVAAGLRRPLPWPVAVVAAVVLTFLTWHVGSLVAQAGVDPSWQVALHLTQTRGIRFGPDFVWTYGPLGFLAFPLAVSGWTLAAAVAFVLATQAALAYVLLVRAGRAFGGVLSVVAAYLVLMLPILPADFVSLVVAALALWALAEPAGSVARLLPVLGGVLAAVAALTKTNMGLAAVAAVLVAAAAGGGRRLGVAVATIVVSFGVLWVVLGNALGDIPQWVRLSLSLVGGYSAAMQHEQAGRHDDYVFAVVVAIVLAAAVWLATGRRPVANRVATALVVAGYAFATFKEAFVRHDVTHVAAYFAATAILLVCLGAAGWARPLVAAGVVLAIVAIGHAGALSVRPWSSAGRAAAHAADAVVPSRRNALIAESRAGQRRSYQVPVSVLRRVRGHTVHVDPWEAALVSAYGLAWRPLPVLQTYSAYTPTLDERNAAFLDSAAAPERILREDPPEHVNGRDRSVEAPATYRAILCDYRQLLATSRWQVLARDPRCGPPRPLGTISAPAGQAVAVPEARPDEIVVAHVDLGDSLGDRLRGFLYKPHVAFLSLGGGPFTSVAASVVRDGIVVHVPGNLGYDPRFGGAIDWRTIAAGGLAGGITFTFDAIPVRGAGPPPVGRRPPRVLPHILLEAVSGGERIVLPDGRALPVGHGGGFVDYGYVRGGSLVLQGWAANVATDVPAREVLVFADGRLVYAGAPNAPRPDVAASLGHPQLRRAGYRVLVPEDEVRANGVRRDVRIFSLVGSRALEVEYPLSYGWRRR